MVILVDGNDVHDHPPKHFFYLQGILGQISRQGKKVGIVDILSPEVRFQQRGRGQDMDPLVLRSEIEALDGEILVHNKVDPRDIDPAFAGRFHVQKLGFPDVVRVIDMTEFDHPMRPIPSFHCCFRSCPARVRTVVIQIGRIAGLFL